MNKAIHILLLLSAIWMMSCNSDIELDIKLPAPCAVLNASLCEDSVIVAHISRTTNAIANIENKEELIHALSIDDARIELFINEESRGIMQNGTKKGEYSMPGCYPSAGDKIRMEVQTKEYEPISAEIMIQERPEITGIDTSMIANNDISKLRFVLRFKEPRKERNFYMLTISGRQIIDNDTIIHNNIRPYVRHNKEFLLEEVYPEYYNSYGYGYYPQYYYPVSTSYIFSDEQIKEGNVGLELTVENIYHSYKSDSLSINNFCRIDLSVISESFYLYNRSKTLQYKQSLDAFGNIGLREPIPTYTNVLNGYGLLSAKQNSSVEIHMTYGENIPPYGGGWYGGY